MGIVEVKANSMKFGKFIPFFKLYYAHQRCVSDSIIFFVEPLNYAPLFTPSFSLEQFQYCHL